MRAGFFMNVPPAARCCDPGRVIAACFALTVGSLVRQCKRHVAKRSLVRGCEDRLCKIYRPTNRKTWFERPSAANSSRANLRPRSRSASVIDRLLKSQNPSEIAARAIATAPGPAVPARPSRSVALIPKAGIRQMRERVSGTCAKPVMGTCAKRAVGTFTRSHPQPRLRNYRSRERPRR